MLEKWPYWDQNHGLTSLEKCQYFDFCNFLFLLARKAFFQSRISKKSFFLPIVPKKKIFEKWPYFDQNHGLTMGFGKMSIFRILELFVFIAYKGAFSF